MDPPAHTHHLHLHLPLTGQGEDLVVGRAVIERRGDDTLRPQSLGDQLVQAHAGGQRVVAGADPVAGGGGDDEPDPARTARPAADDLSTHERHEAAVRFYALSKISPFLEPAAKETVKIILMFSVSDIKEIRSGFSRNMM